jgi:hypothetical protein
MHASVGWPGASADSTVFKATKLFRDLRVADARGWRAGFLPPDCYIGADMAYPNLSWLLVPFSNQPDVPLSARRRLFSERLRSARRVVERAFG